LIKLSEETGQFIPVLRYFLEVQFIIVRVLSSHIIILWFIQVYTLFDPNKVQQSNKKTLTKKAKKEANKKSSTKDDESEKSKSTKYQTKTINFEVMLKVNKEQTTEMEFVQKVFDKLYTLCLHYTASQSWSIAFPEMVSIFLHQV